MHRRTAVPLAVVPLAVVPLAAAAAGLAARRSRARRSAAALAPDAPARPEPPKGRERTVVTEDGVDLHVEEHGPAEGEGAVEAVLVLAHGYTQGSRLWGGVVRDLLTARPRLRVVVYDHRGHGRSGRATQETATLEQLARDLHRVVETVTEGRSDLPVLLGGHSMGGMTLMALAEQHPELFEGRVAGVAFIGTSSGGLDEVPWGLPAPLVPLFKKLLPVANRLAYEAERRGRARRQIRWFEAFVNFAAGADPADVQDVLDVQAECSAETMHFFLATFSDHDRGRALDALAHVPSLVVVGEQDRLCPVEHSRAIAAALPRSELVLFPGAGHMVHLERRPEVVRHLAALVDRSLAARSAERMSASA
ncbi:MAG: alpha/beta fold hydrolase [Actinomycetes bacterium]